MRGARNPHGAQRIHHAGDLPQDRLDQHPQTARAFGLRRFAMKKLLWLAALTVAAPALAQVPAPPSNIVEKSSDYRFQMDYQVNQAALNKLLPPGWESAVAAQ